MVDGNSQGKLKFQILVSYKYAKPDLMSLDTWKQIGTGLRRGCCCGRGVGTSIGKAIGTAARASGDANLTIRSDNRGIPLVDRAY